MSWNIHPEHEELAFLMEAGLIYRDAKRFLEAEEVFRGVRALVPDSDVPEVALGTLYFARGKMKDAQKHYTRALELNPRSAFAYAHLGEAQLFQKDKAAAQKSLKRAVELDPKGDHGRLARSLLQLADEVKFKNPA
jgi:tetratricopeptide (TPR) repeat protein